MTDMVHVDEEEQRLRDRLKAKSQKRREGKTAGSSSSSREREPEDGRGRSHSPANRHQHHSDRRGNDYYHGNRDRYSPYDSRDRRRPNRDEWRGREDSYGRIRPPLYHRNPEPETKHDSYYPPPVRGGRRDFYEDGRYDGRSVSPASRYRRRGSRSVSRSRSRSRSCSRSSKDEDLSSRSNGSRGRNRQRQRHVRRSSSRSRSGSPSDSASHSASSQSSVESPPGDGKSSEAINSVYSKDQRTVFVTQLVQRTVERDIKKYFSKNNIKVNEVILLRDKRTGRHKGGAYVELRCIEDVAKAVALSNVVPNFQRFPILIKASEAEKNYVAAPAASALTAAQMGKKVQSGPLVHNGKLLEAQKVYVGSLDPSVTQEHLFVLFSQFGQLEKVSLQVDQATGVSKGFAFLSFRDPKEANLAIQTMGNQVLAGRPMKTGWAVNQIASIPGAEVVTSNEFPPDASTRVPNAYKILGQLTMGVPVSQIGQVASVPVSTVVSGGVSRVPTVAEARATLAASAPMSVSAPFAAVAPTAQQASQWVLPVTAAGDDPTRVGNSECPTNHILVHNMFDKDAETEPGWENDIKEEFEEECSKFGKILNVQVMSKEIGGKIYASFDSIQGAQNCASSLAGRWFDKRRLRVEFVEENGIPSIS